MMEEQTLSPELPRLRINKHIQVAKVDCPHGYCFGFRIYVDLSIQPSYALLAPYYDRS